MHISTARMSLCIDLIHISLGSGGEPTSASKYKAVNVRACSTRHRGRDAPKHRINETSRSTESGTLSERTICLCFFEPCVLPFAGAVLDGDLSECAREISFTTGKRTMNWRIGSVTTNPPSLFRNVMSSFLSCGSRSTMGGASGGEVNLDPKSNVLSCVVNGRRFWDSSFSLPLSGFSLGSSSSNWHRAFELES